MTSRAEGEVAQLEEHVDVVPLVVEEASVEPGLDPLGQLLEFRVEHEAILVDQESDRVAGVVTLLEKFSGLAGAEAQTAVTVHRDEGPQPQERLAVEVGLATRLLDRAGLLDRRGLDDGRIVREVLVILGRGLADRRQQRRQHCNTQN